MSGAAIGVAEGRQAPQGETVTAGIVVKHGAHVAVFRCAACTADPAAACACIFAALAHARARGLLGGVVRTYSHDGRLLASTKLEEAREHASKPMARRKAAA